MIDRAAFPRISDSQWEKHLEIIERTRERNTGIRVHILQKFFDIRRLHFPATCGTFAWSSTAIKTKWLSAPHSINFGGGYVTPGDMARDYLATKYGSRRVRCTTEQWQKCVQFRKQPPLLVNPQRIERAGYLDLSGAFWQIVRAVGWDVSYNPHKFVGCNSRMIDFPYAHHKMARNCLVSVGIPAPMRFWTGKEMQFIKKPSKFVNLILWTLVQDVLNGVAADMAEIGAAYINTDGYILPDNVLDAGFDILNDWGLEGRLKHYGEVDIVSIGTYCFQGSEGTYATQNYKRNPNRAGRAVRKIDESAEKTRSWLRPRFAKFGHFAIGEWEWIEK